MKKRVQRGFTLVEVIVTLVVLAIIAAIAIPAFTKYIDDANTKRCTVHRGELMDKYSTYLMYQGKKRIDANYTSSDVAAYVDKMYGANQFHCPSSDGTYTMDAATRTITCSKHGAMGSGKTTAVVALAAIQDGFEKVKAGTIKNAANQTQNATAAIDGISATDPTTFAYQIMQQLPPETQDYLNSFSWSVTTAKTWLDKKNGTVKYQDNSGDPTDKFYILFTLSYHDSKDSSRGTTDAPLVVYKYDMATKQYKYTTTGKLEEGKITTAGTDWSEWSSTMDAPG